MTATLTTHLTFDRITKGKKVNFAEVTFKESQLQSQLKDPLLNQVLPTVNKCCLLIC